MPNQQLAKESDKPILRKFEKRKVYSSFIDNVWRADVADMQLISKFNKRFWFLTCDICSKYAGADSLKDKKSITVTKSRRNNCSRNIRWVLM